jgi:hypothetical protein
VPATARTRPRKRAFSSAAEMRRPSSSATSTSSGVCSRRDSAKAEREHAGDALAARHGDSDDRRGGAQEGRLAARRLARVVGPALDLRALRAHCQLDERGAVN